MKEETYTLRVKTDLENAISIDLKGCGQLYIEPRKEYFFENAPIQFIEYVASLKVLNVSYKLTKDKKGCYKTIDLTNYNLGNPLLAAMNFRGGYTPQINTIPTVPVYETKGDRNDDIPDLIPADTFSGEPNELNIDIKTTEVPEGQMSIDDFTDGEDEGIKPEDTTTQDTPEQEPVQDDVPVEKLSDAELEDMSKANLIEYAHSIGLDKVSDILTKKEIRVEIKKAYETM